MVYLSLAAFLLPFQMITGILYWGYNHWPAWGIEFLSLKWMGILHMFGAINILTFIVVHVYMTTTGHSLSAHVKAMITGWEGVEEGVKIEEWEKAERI